MLSAEGLQKSFKSRQVVRDFAFSIREGEVVGLLGPNGAGDLGCRLVEAMHAILCMVKLQAMTY